MKKHISPLKFIRAGAILLSTFLTMVSPFLAKAASVECNPIDLRSQLGPVRDQGDIGWCYANAAADLLTYHYRDELKGEQVSDIHVALNFTKNYIGIPFFEGGSSFLSAWSYMKRKKLCLHKAEHLLLTKGLKDKNDKPIPLSQKLKEVALLKKTFDARHENPKAYKAQYDKIKSSESFLFSMGEDKLKEILSKTSASQFPHVISDTLCEPYSVEVQEKETPGIMSPYFGFPMSMIHDKIDETLENGKPVAMAYYGSFLTSPTGEKTIKSAHMSLLVGRRWGQKSQQCEYLIRNSWGTTCTPYQKSPTLKNNCEAGHVWIPEENLKDILWGISYF